jgi:calcium-translocating P-type ATPase, PMCA-type
MFNAKAYRTGRSAFHNIGKSQGFLMIAAAIVLGQVFITTFGGGMFSVTPLQLVDWAIIIGATSIVLWIGEIRRSVAKGQ